MPCLTFPTPLGPCRLTWNDGGLTSFHLPEAEGVPGNAASTVPPPAETPLAQAPGWVQDLVARIERHLGGRLQDFRDVPLDERDLSSFARRVYRETRGILAGQTRTYGELAAMLELPPSSSRAVGATLAANPWPLIVPCHRVLDAEGGLRGFSAPGGVRTKARLLALEGAQLLSE